MWWPATTLILFSVFLVLSEARPQRPGHVNVLNSSQVSVNSTGGYVILRAEILQTTVNVSSANASFLTLQEDFEVVAQGTNPGALPVQCGAGWVTVFTTYPATIPLLCSDPELNVTLLQGEVWPEYGGFYLYVDYKGLAPAVWMVGNHLSSLLGWDFAPLTNDIWPPGGEWVWSGTQIINQMATISLQDWTGSNSTNA